MTEEHADRYVSNALSWNEGSDSFELVVGERSLPALVEAFARRGIRASAQAMRGVLLVNGAEGDGATPPPTNGGAEML
jgi:hypothetical protein